MGGRPSLEETVEVDGRTFRALRKARRLTQARLAALAAPVSRSYLSNIEGQARAQVGRDLAERLAVALGADLAFFLAPSAGHDLAHPALPFLAPAPSGSDAGRPLGERIEELTVAARLSEGEAQVVAEHLVRHAGEVIALIRAARRLPPGV